MAKKIEPDSEATYLGFVHLDVEELIKIIDNNTSDEETVIIENNGMRIEGIGDIKNNASLLEGFPKIEIIKKDQMDSITITLTYDNTRVYAYKSYVGADQLKFSNIFKKYRPWPTVYKILLFPTFITMNLFQFRNLAESKIGTEASHVLIGLSIVAAGFLIAGVIHAIIFSKSVVFVPRQGFMRRNLDNIIVGVIMLMIGTALGMVLKY